MANLEIRPPEWNDDAPIRIEASLHIAASAEAVFAQLAEHTSWPEWVAELSKVEVTGSPTGVGGKRRAHIRGLGTFDEEFNTWEPGRAFGFSVVAATVPAFRSINEMITISDEDATGVTVHYLQAIQPARWSAPIVSLLRKRVQRSLKEALHQLATRVQA